MSYKYKWVTNGLQTKKASYNIVRSLFYPFVTYNLYYIVYYKYIIKKKIK